MSDDPWTRTTWESALKMALLKGDEDAVTALLAMQEAELWVREHLDVCFRHEHVHHVEDGCPMCAKGWE